MCIRDSPKAANTRTAYASDWARFAGWCADRDLAALPAAPATLGAYLTAAATDPAAPGYTPATLTRWVAAVNFAHRRAGHPAPGAHPHVGELLAGIGREHGRPPARRDALVTADLRAILAGKARSRPSPTAPRWPPAGRAPGPGGGGSSPPPTPAGGSPSCAPCAPTTRPATSAGSPPPRSTPTAMA